MICAVNWVPYDATAQIKSDAAKSLSPDVLIALMLQTVDDPNAEWFSALKVHPDERVQTIAVAVDRMRRLGMFPELYIGATASE